MTYLAILGMMLIAFAAAAWPLVVTSSRRVHRQSLSSLPSDHLVGERDAAYQAIGELDFEYDLGNLSEPDYRALRERYRSEAAATLQKLDTTMEVGTAEAAAATSAEASAGDDFAKSRGPGLTCLSCGGAMEIGDSFCATCGARLGRSCPSCGGPAEADDRFCAACGVSLETTA